MYYNRRVHTKELAERVACVSTKDLNKIAEKVYKSMNVTIYKCRTHISHFGDKYLLNSEIDL
jgi:hypothetical protein